MKNQGFGIRLNGIIGFLFMVGVLILLFFLAKGIFNLLQLVAPVLIILTLLINYRTVVNFLKYMLNLLRRNPLVGIVGVVLCVIGFPILSGVLFFKSIFDRKVRKLEKEYHKQKEGEFVEYEEVIRDNDEETIELPPLEKRGRDSATDPYKDLF
jgi:hypothetical protein